MRIILNNRISAFERVTSSIENKFGQLSDLLISVKNSTKTLLFGSECRKNENINWICAKFINRNTVPINDKYDTINEKKLSLDTTISPRFKHHSLSGNATELFSLVKNELLKQQNNKLSFTNGHPSEQVNLMLATLYEVHEQASVFEQEKIHPGLNRYLKSQIECLIKDNFIIEEQTGNEKRTVNNEDGKVIGFLKNMHDKYKEELEHHKKALKEKIDYKMEEFDKLQDVLKENSLI
ncbi:Uncharacterised protein [Proteus vulgaris]|uniref:hypothetical protein n=1 Tax=Proteus vulgaris TaxID=585 RepID=UPI000E07F441|nr:hypothetical protein [Proteus vulgaris]SUC00305.1 Uncharacterised protein [Proteus vulgaris]